MRSTVCILLITSGCGSSGATQPLPVVVAPTTTAAVVAPHAIAVVPASTASASPVSPVSPPSPPSPGKGTCAEGAPVNMAKVFTKIEGSFSRAGVHQMIATASCEANGAEMDARILAVRDDDGVFKIARLELLTGAHSTILKMLDMLARLMPSS